MGATCCGAHTGLASSSAAKYHLPSGNSQVNKITRNVPPVLNVLEENRARVRERAVQALIDSLHSNEATIPTAKWRRQYLKIASVGLAVATTLADFLTQCSRARKTKSKHMYGTTPADRIPASATHSIVTLDLRGLKIGDEGLSLLAPALLEDTIIQNVVLTGNQITDSGINHFMDSVIEGVASNMQLLILTNNPISSAGLRELGENAVNLPALKRLEVGRGFADAEDGDVETETLTSEAVDALIKCICAKLDVFVFKGTGNYTQADFTSADLTRFLNKVVRSTRLSGLNLQDCYATKSANSQGNSAQKENQGSAAPHLLGGGKQQGGAHRTGSPVIKQQQQTPQSSDPEINKPISTLAAALRSPDTVLTTLILHFPLSDEATKLLCSGLRRAVKLQKLSLRGCDLSAAALSTLGDAVKENRTLVALDVSYQSSAITHPVVLAELRASSKRRHSMTSFAGLRDEGGDVTDKMRAAREHALLPIIKALHTNRILQELIMLGINYTTEDLEELCSCIEQSRNHVIKEVMYTSAGCEALDMKLEGFLSSNRENGGLLAFTALGEDPGSAAVGGNGASSEDPAQNPPSHDSASSLLEPPIQSFHGVPAVNGFQPANVSHHPPRSTAVTPTSRQENEGAGAAKESMTPSFPLIPSPGGQDASSGSGDEEQDSQSSSHRDDFSEESESSFDVSKHLSSLATLPQGPSSFLQSAPHQSKRRLLKAYSPTNEEKSFSDAQEKKNSLFPQQTPSGVASFAGSDENISIPNRNARNDTMNSSPRYSNSVTSRLTNPFPPSVEPKSTHGATTIRERKPQSFSVPKQVPPAFLSGEASHKRATRSSQSERRARQRPERLQFPDDDASNNGLDSSNETSMDKSMASTLPNMNDHPLNSLSPASKMRSKANN